MDIKKIIYTLILSLGILLVLSLEHTNYCVQLNSLSDFENTINAMMSYMPTDNDNYKALLKLFNSNAWLENKSSLPFGSYDNFILRSHYDTSTKWYIEFLFYDTNNVTFTVNTQYINRNESFTVKNYRFNIVNLGTTYNPRYDGQQTDLTINNNTLNRLITTTYGFSIFFVDNDFINAQNYEVWGVNYPILDYYTYNYSINLPNITVDDFNEMRQIIIGDARVKIAEFGRTTHFVNAAITYWAYDKEKGYFEPYTSKTTTNYNIINTDLGELYFTYNQFVPNTVMQFLLFSNDINNYPTLSILYYAVDDNTIINNGILDIPNTFNNSYYNKYRYDLDKFNNTNSGGMITNNSGDTTGYIDLEPINDSIQDINDNLTDDSQVNNILSEYISGDKLIQDIGYFTVENPFTTIILNTMSNFTDALLGSGDQIIETELLNTQIRINSNQFKLPNGRLKSFISLMCNAFVVWNLIKYGFQLYQWIKTGQLTNAMNHANNHQYYLF